MDIMDSYKVDLKGMTEDAVSHHWVLTDDFFSAVQGPEIQHGQLDVALRVKRTSGAYELDFQMDGIVKVECDRCLELMDQEIHTEQSLKVQLGQEYCDDGETIVIPENEGVIGLDWQMYEMAALQIPIRHVHPDGECNPQVLEMMNGKRQEEDTDYVDPRWEALKQMKNKQ